MSDEWKRWIKAWSESTGAAAQNRQHEFTSLTDDELMELENSLWATREQVFPAGPADDESLITRLAVWYEVDRRSWAACWFWRRWLRPRECEKWLDLRKRLKAHVAALTQEHLSQGGEPP